MSNQVFWRILTTADLAPIESAAPFILRAGLTPTVAVLRQGQFVQRSEVFAALWKSFAEWREAPKDDRDRLPVFWIEGNPGDGKSVLLLQLLAACLQEQLTPSIAWLEHAPDGRAFHEKPPVNSGWYFCAEIPTRLEGTVRDNWMSSLLDAGATALVTSGDSEIRHGFEFHFEYCAKVTKFALPPFSISETEPLAEWYNTCTGISRDATILWREGMSLTEFLFALHHGRAVVELTSDIRGALGNLGLGGRVRAVWLANALGLRAPGSLLATDAARIHAAKISERGVVPVEVDEAGLRLAPPTIAWPLIGTWLAEKHELQHLGEALACVLKMWLDTGDENSAIRLLHQLWGTEWLIDERPVGHGNPFIQLKRKEVLRWLYRAHRRDFAGQPAPSLIPAWLEINEAFSLMLLPDPAACATEIFSKPENESRRSPSLAATTWLAADSRRPPVGVNARNAVANYFLSPATGSDVGGALMKLVRNTKRISEARPIAEGWIKLFPDDPETLNVVGALVKRGGGSEEFLAWAMERFARPAESSPGAAKFLASVLEGRPHNQSARRRAGAWAWSRPLEPETGVIWFALLMEKLAAEDVLRGAIRWLAANPTHGVSDVMRQRLLTHYPHAYGAAWVMQEWLKRHSADEHTPGLLLKLLEAQPNSRTASAVALEWLNNSLTNPACPVLLRWLLKHPDLAFQATAERWLETGPNSQSHAELLAECIRELRGVPKWIARGEAYAKNPQHPGREHVIAALLSVNGCQTSHARLALQVLSEIPDEPRVFLEIALGRSLALYPLQAEKTFRQFTGAPQIPALARAYSRGLTQLPDTRSAFLHHVLPVMGGEAAFLALCHLIYADARSTEVTAAIRIWLQENYRQRGYTPLIGALHNHPKVWRALLATRRLDKRVIADFQNYHAEIDGELKQSR